MYTIVDLNTAKCYHRGGWWISKRFDIIARFHDRVKFGELFSKQDADEIASGLDGSFSVERVL